MDTQPVAVIAVEEMEKAAQVPEGHDCGGTRAGSCASDMDTNNSMAISDAEGGAVRPESQMVRSNRANLSPGVLAIGSLTIGWGLLIEERLTWPVRAVLWGGGSPESYLLSRSYLALVDSAWMY